MFLSTINPAQLSSRSYCHEVGIAIRSGLSSPRSILSSKFGRPRPHSTNLGSSSSRTTIPISYFAKIRKNPIPTRADHRTKYRRAISSITFDSRIRVREKFLAQFMTLCYNSWAKMNGTKICPRLSKSFESAPLSVYFSLI